MPGLLLRCYDVAYRWLHGLRDPAAGAGPVVRVAVRRHRGPTVVLRDGTAVRRGDRIGIIHLDNERVAAFHGDGSQTPIAGLRFRRAFVASLRELARQVLDTDRYAGVQAFTTQTIMHAGTQRAGFEILPLRSSTWSRVVAAYERALLARYHPRGRRGARRHRFTDARAIWISRDGLLSRYGPEHCAPARGAAPEASP
ncbi:MAG: hypothetical protein HY726_06870 [Candidatus Rokubacteria bacterium]|nr:hypothetical protein [Candidatus Rokubacteria bacterium]